MGESCDSLRCWCPQAPTLHLSSSRYTRTRHMPHLQHSKAVLGEGTTPLPPNLLCSHQVLYNPSDTHKGYRKQIWGAESNSPGGSEYFSAGLSLGSSMSSPAHAGRDVQDEVGTQGKEQGLRPIPSSTSVNPSSCEPLLAPQWGCASRDKLLLQWQQHWQAIPSVLIGLGAKSTRKMFKASHGPVAWKGGIPYPAIKSARTCPSEPLHGQKKISSLARVQPS